MKRYYLLTFVLFLTISFVIAHSSERNEVKVKMSTEMGCSICDPGSTTPTVLIDYYQTEGSECCIYFEGPPNTSFQVVLTCNEEFLCEERTDGDGVGKCCYSGSPACSEIAIITAPNGCDCYSLPICS